MIDAILFPIITEELDLVTINFTISFMLLLLIFENDTERGFIVVSYCFWIER